MLVMLSCYGNVFMLTVTVLGGQKGKKRKKGILFSNCLGCPKFIFLLARESMDRPYIFYLSNNLQRYRL